jgi:hypothetical protein
VGSRAAQDARRTRRAVFVIGGKVLDASALSHFATVKSIYAQAVAWAAFEDNTVLVVPAAALTVAWADIPSSGHEVLEVLLNLPVTVIDIPYPASGVPRDVTWHPRCRIGGCSAGLLCCGGFWVRR